MNLKWQTPPEPKSARRKKYDDIRDALMERPGRWALIAERQANRNIGDALRQYGGIEVTTRLNANREIDIYARYVEPINLGECVRCGKRGKVNAEGACRIHAPLMRAA